MLSRNFGIISASPNINEMAGQARHDDNTPSKRHAVLNQVQD